MSSSDLGALATGLLPVLFILLLGYVAARRRRFDPDQASGSSSLVVDDRELLLVIAVTFAVGSGVGYLVAIGRYL